MNPFAKHQSTGLSRLFQARPSLQDLAVRALRGDEAALCALIVGCQQLLTRCLCHKPEWAGKHRESEREEVVQEALIEIFDIHEGAFRRSFDPALGHIESFALKILNGKAVDRIRYNNGQKRSSQRTSSMEIDVMDALLTDDDAPFQVTIEERNYLEAVWSWLKAQLEPRDLLIAMLRFRDESSVEEIACAVNLTQRQIYTRIDVIRGCALEFRSTVNLTPPKNFKKA